MANVSQVGGVPDDEFISRAEAAAQLAEQAAADAQQAALDAQAAAAAAQAAVDAQRFQDHADSDPAWPTEVVGNYMRYGASGWTHEAFSEAMGALSDVNDAGILDGQGLIRSGGVYVPFTPVNPADFLLLAGGTMTGTLTLAGDPATILEAATKQYVDAQLGTVAPYDIAAYYDGLPTASEDIFKFVAVRDYYLDEDLTGSVAESTIAATAQTDFDIQKNGVSIGTIRFAAASATATFIFATATNFVSGDVLGVVAPATPDATLEDISITLIGVLGSIAP